MLGVPPWRSRNNAARKTTCRGTSESVFTIRAPSCQENTLWGDLQARFQAAGKRLPASPQFTALPRNCAARDLRTESPHTPFSWQRGPDFAKTARRVPRQAVFLATGVWLRPRWSQTQSEPSVPEEMLPSGTFPDAYPPHRQNSAPTTDVALRSGDERSIPYPRKVAVQLQLFA